MTVRQIMNSNVVYLTPDDTAVRAARLLDRHNIGILPICSKDGRLRGIVTDRDIALRCIALDTPPEETRLREIMTRGVIAISPDTAISEAANVMAAEQIRRLPVVENNKLIGMLSIADIAGQGKLATEFSSALAEISASKRRYKR